MVHRDIKAKNILMDVNDQCYLANFGAGKEWVMNSTMIETFSLTPEINRDSVYDGTVADIYSFGIFLYEILSSPWRNYKCQRVIQRDETARMRKSA
ncbi:unnamed protein product [Rotaria socialis]|uniref:Protein kinase domain-containing protein n=1 Tax=Rotaria socialis TaxID=392032 RepID=A0A817U3L5_9BILA|nr:unnamed protein product [Rotaria socialis]CAF4197374.1 unnamed protein product [Rotaria socialis]